MRTVSTLQTHNSTDSAGVNYTQSGEVLVLRHQTESVLVVVPDHYSDLEEICRDEFTLPKTATLIFETSDLNICQGKPTRITKHAWDAIRLVVGAVTVGIRGEKYASSRIHDTAEGRVSFLPYASVHVGETEYSHPPASTSKQAILAGSARKPHPRLYHGTPQDNDAAPIYSPTSPLAGKSPAPARNTLHPRGDTDIDDTDTAADDDNDDEDKENRRATADDYDDDEDENEPPVRSPLKGKGKTPIRRRILSDDEGENDENERPASNVYVDSISSAKKNVSLGHRSVPRQENVDDLFSPKASKTSRVRIPLQTSPTSDEEAKAGESSETARGSSDTYEFVASPINDGSTKKAEDLFADDTEFMGRGEAKATLIGRTLNSGSSRQTREEDSAASPLAKPSASRTKPSHNAARGDTTESNQAPAASADDKLLITITYPPTDLSSKFKVKGKHNIGKVLLSACKAFGLDYDMARLYLQDGLDDGVEMTYECKKEDTLTSCGVASGAMFTIIMDDEE